VMKTSAGTLRVAAFLAYSSVARANAGVIILTVLILALAGLNLLFVPGLLEGLVASSDIKVRDTFAGDLVVESATENPLIQDPSNIINDISRIEGVVAATPRNTIGAELKLGNERTTCTVSGIEPETEPSVFTIDRFMIEGSYLTKDDADVVLGIQLAGADKENIELYSRSLKHAHAGDTITVTYANGIARNYKVKGIFRADFIQTDLQALISEREFESVNPAARGMAQSIRVKTSGKPAIDGVREAIIAIRPGLRVFPWEDYAGIMRSMTDSFNVINTILNVVNVLVAGITVFIVTYIDVTNRRKQIGIQRAIGITPGSLVLAYLLRVAFYAVVAIGIAWLGFVFVIMPVEARFPFHFPFGPVYLAFGSHSLLRASVILMCSAIVAALIPVWMSLRVRILDAIWG
jgi:putative ABC transport system permease protein